MNWKEFLTFSKWKIIIFLIIPGVFHISIYGMNITTNFKYIFVPMIFYIPGLIMNLGPMNPNSSHPIDTYYNGSYIHPMETILLGIISITGAYFVACLIFLIIKKKQ